MKKTPTHLRATDIRAAAQLATQATVSVTSIVEGVHQSVLSTIGLKGTGPEGKTSGLTGLIYRSIGGVTQLVGKSVDVAVGTLQPLIDALEAKSQTTSTPQREATLAALNGVMGDRLFAAGNSFATPMSIFFEGSAIDWQAPPASLVKARKILLFVHGLCMNDQQWSHGERLKRELGYTCLYLRYNTGLTIAENGHNLSAQLALLIQHWPSLIEELSIICHSMGGLVTRSAIHAAQQKSGAWLTVVKKVVFLGSPHCGAPLEQAGNWVDLLLGASPYTKPFVMLTKLRSAGITDLRYGEILDSRQREFVPLPDRAGIEFYAVAATIAKKRSALSERLIGDGLVPVNSALGKREDSNESLGFGNNSTEIFYEMNHMQLLHSEVVTNQLVKWLISRHL
jgi:pimeloyl-ACP methyl ester carboxylesterase